MNLDNIVWNKKTYNEFVKYLIELKDESYKNFHFKLLKNDKINLIGIRTPILKQIAKKIAKTDYLEFIKYNNHTYYEEIILHGLVITYLKIDFKEIIKLFEDYIKYIDNWASCDLIISNFKIFKNNLELGFKYINKYINDKKPWINRVGIVLLLNYYINDTYIDKILNICNNIKTDDYYVKMSNAWLISMCLIKYYDKTYNFLTNNNLDDWTHKKAIQKSIESYRIKNKEEIKKLKRLN
ncbi:MAG: DNA alkylation repair protein [Firmicutes bacterium]|nr:DNA alkylation repair protein [Bacillota bacterium]